MRRTEFTKREADTAQFCEIFHTGRICPNCGGFLPKLDRVLNWNLCDLPKRERMARLGFENCRKELTPPGCIKLDDHVRHAVSQTHGRLIIWSPYCSIREAQNNKALQVLADVMRKYFGYRCMLSTLNLYHCDGMLNGEDGSPYVTIIWCKGNAGRFDPQCVIH